MRKYGCVGQAGSKGGLFAFDRRFRQLLKPDTLASGNGNRRWRIAPRIIPGLPFFIHRLARGGGREQAVVPIIGRREVLTRESSV